MSDKFNALLSREGFIYLDGGMGTMLQSFGVETEHVPEMLNLTSPEVVKKYTGSTPKAALI